MTEEHHKRLLKFAEVLERALGPAVQYDEAMNFEAMLQEAYGEVTTTAEAGVLLLISDIREAMPLD